MKSLRNLAITTATISLALSSPAAHARSTMGALPVVPSVGEEAAVIGTTGGIGWPVWAAALAALVTGGIVLGSVSR